MFCKSLHQIGDNVKSGGGETIFSHYSLTYKTRFKYQQRGYSDCFTGIIETDISDHFPILLISN